MYTFDWLARQADLRPDKIALVDSASGREFTYAQFNARASRFAAFMRAEWHIQPGDRVAILTHNCSDYFEILYACGKIGALLVPLNWRLALPELQGILQDCTPRALIYDDTFVEVASALGEGLPVPPLSLTGKGPGGEGGYEDTLASISDQSIVMPARPLDAHWYILYTAGTTGRPKGVIQTFGMALFNYLNIGLAINLTAADVTLNALPVFHTGGNNLYTNPTFLVGGTAIIQRQFDAAQTIKLLAERVTVFFGVPAMYLFISQHPTFGNTDFSHMRSWACGGAPMPLSLLELYAGRGIYIRQGFGMTETGPTVFLVDEAHAVSKAGSVGRPQIFVDVRIVDQKGQDMPLGEMGELLIKGPAVTPGYWGLPEVTARTIEDGWLHSGDVARRDEDGYYYIVDRLKDMFISGGENVYPAEVENVLFAHPAIAEATVIGMPDPRWGEVGLAVIVARPGHTLTEQEVIAFCQDKLARYKIPRSVVFVDALPRNAAGKVLKTELRKRFGA
ncbi:MAG: long-chain fatty acid--CoA ligase [Ktedonobacteraceae bacterium]|nr:long-chain fatty acid--CoA ligase [Ktedonobacteraceae bacterium]